jgi:predicted MPP superfamily phosphohydrolase
MVLAPILVRVLERGGMDLQARLVAHLGYLWMGFFFLLLSASILLDLLRAVLAAAGWLLHRDLVPGEAQLLAASILLALAASLYGMFEARCLRVEQVTLVSPKIPQSVGRVRIVQISDVHLGLMVGRPGLKRILEQVAALKPDLVFSTGDLVDGQMDGLRGLDRELSALKPPLGKYAVLGNHEAYAGGDASASFTNGCGFRLLQGQSVAVADFLTVAGVDDPALTGGERGAAELALLSSLPPDRYTILLKHRPKVEKQSQGLFDLQLSGHVHKGQIFPFNLVTHLAYPVKMGLSRAGAGSHLYVSRGSGTWGPPMRVLAPPEVTVIDLFPSAS